MAAARRFSVEISLILVLFLHFINRMSSNVKSGLSVMYDSRRAVCFAVVFVEDFNSWVPVSVVGVDRVIVVFVFIDDSIIVSFRFNFIKF